jgi:hypothetical protein
MLTNGGAPEEPKEENVLKKFVFVFLALTWCATNAHAALLDCTAGNGVSLASLIASEGCQVGDKLFSGFTDTPNPSNSNPNPNDITVKGTVTNGDPGLHFSGMFGVGPGQGADFLISYVVTVLDPTRLLSDIHLFFNGFASGTGFAGVTETVFSQNPFAIIGQAAVSTVNPPGSLQNTVVLTQPVRSALVQKDIILFGGANGFATISFVDQITSQTSTVPEPASMTLLGTGLLGLVRLARNRRRKVA